MTRILLLVVTALTLICTPAIDGGGGPARGQATAEISELELVVQTSDGELLLARFLVDAPDRREALLSAGTTLRSLYPGATVVNQEDADGIAGPTTGDAGVVRAQWNAWGWNWDGAELPVAVGYDPGGAAAGFSAADVVNALATWSNVPGSSFAYAYDGETTLLASMNHGGEDGRNVIAWQDLGCNSGCVLGLTTKSFLTHEVDISLNSNAEARLGDTGTGIYDVLTVLIHELGHMAGLEHSCPPLGPCTAEETDAAMYWSYRGVHHQLEADDIAGLVGLYPGESVTSSAAGPVPGPGVSATESAPSGSVSLAPGWNLTQLPTGPFDAYSTSLSCVRAIYAYDAIDKFGWSHWVRDLAPSLQTLHAAEPGVAYWVLSDGSCTASFQ